MGDRGKRGKEASVEERVIAVLFLCNVKVLFNLRSASIFVSL